MPTAKSEAPESPLLVNEKSEPLSSLWRQIGKIWFVLLLLSLYFDYSVFFVVSAIGIVLVFLASVDNSHSSPRHHPASIPFMMLTSSLLLSSLFSLEPLNHFSNLIFRFGPAFFVFFGITWLFRTKKDLKFLFLILLLLGSVEFFRHFYEFLFMADEIESTYRSPVLVAVALVFGLSQIWFRRGYMVLVLGIMFLFCLFAVGASVSMDLWIIAGIGSVLYLMTREEKLIASIVSVFIAVAVLFGVYYVLQEKILDLDFPLHSETRFQVDDWQVAFETFGSSPIIGSGPIQSSTTISYNNLQYFLTSFGSVGLFFLLLTLAILYLTTSKELKRWQVPRFERRSYIAAMASLGAILITAVLFNLFRDGKDIIALSVIGGVGVVSRELLVKLDYSRHPRRRIVPFVNYIEELSHALGSLSAVFPGFSYLSAKKNGFSDGIRISTGDGLVYSPYCTGDPIWVPVCMHMHSNRWEGMFTPEEMVQHYHFLGAQAVLITDHNRISKTSNPLQTMPAYEHGWGTHNHHILALNARRQFADRYPFGSNKTAKSDTIARLRENADFLILAHPPHRNAWNSFDVCHLDYDALEIFNKYKDNMGHWDTALSSGRLTWGTAGEDNHDLRSPHQSGKRYLLVDARESVENREFLESYYSGKHSDVAETQQSRLKALKNGAFLTPDELLRALRAGRYINVRKLSAEPTYELPPRDSIEIVRFDRNDDSFLVETKYAVERAVILVNNAAVLKEEKNTSILKFSLEKHYSYFRVMLINGEHSIALNPIARLKTD